MHWSARLLDAWVAVREQPHYRREAFVAGLKRIGCKVTAEQYRAPERCDESTVYVCWNRYGHTHQIGLRVEAAGGRVIVAENGYLGRDAEDRQLYALALHGHNGSGTWPEGGPERFGSLGIDLKPWRASGDKVVIRGQRGIGAPDMASPPDWHGKLAAHLRGATARPIEVVPHPGNGAERDRSHEDYLQKAHALAIWSSSVGVKALALGVPVFYAAPHWICEGAARRIDELEMPLMDDELRLTALRRMAWAQWSVDEITSGEPFKALLQ